MEEGKNIIRVLESENIYDRIYDTEFSNEKTVK